MPSHAGELEDKKQQLQRIRERRAKRQKERSNKGSDDAPATALEALKDFKLPKVNRAAKLTKTTFETSAGVDNPYVMLPSVGDHEVGVQTVIQGAGTTGPAAPEILPHGALDKIHAKEEALARDIDDLRAQLEAKEKEIGEMQRKKERQEAKAKQIPSLEEKDAKRIMSEHLFEDFITRTTNQMELVLQTNELYDPTVDYSYGPDSRERRKVKDNVDFDREYFNEKSTLGRTVTALDYNPMHKELLCAAYNENANDNSQPDGLVLVWNAKMQAQDRPFYAFECQSAVLSCKFAPYMPNVIVGGTYSGEVVLWDNRTPRRTPVQRSTITTQGKVSHTTPVYCIDVVGTQNAHFLVSASMASSDSKMCNWDLDGITSPQDTIELVADGKKPISASAFSFPLNETNNFVVGSEDGAVFSCHRHGSKQGQGVPFQRGIEQLTAPNMLTAHHGPVTGVSFFNASTDSVLTDYFLSSSADWTVKLWSRKRTEGPLYTFDTSEDYVYDVACSPTNPAVFASCNGQGQLDIWNINNSTEEPITTVIKDEKGATEGLNKIKWSNDGREIAVGTASGRVKVFRVSDGIALPNDAEKEVEMLKSKLKEMEDTAHEAHAVAAANAAAGVGGIGGLAAPAPAY
mmetsp:Transcript_17346/g.45272  ORF Transcript_17346/g.45272 Transcript_17346/m.45272 type:complete len:630 (-) Transcript_17346:40-1929(-)|eukprot:CAMPEP_0182927484 /NCGR_PEP_ID=MMETSP0105_2-20130417/13804_1 /TAXON_ID=81532 ORGANISM="Acanthoeca-like sp., Strain 10tr" /NCGR_SAMPLE_ID=MMETSP0105_2 /ASSEMBLY_ACC=CAM_ASM_000205 /LENGTH=629 /DNA_ID=CAMNT_0025065433 /DNA_START=92 /DNA_END=1981 /DNA_ORIENTATION=+